MRFHVSQAASGALALALLATACGGTGAPSTQDVAGPVAAEPVAVTAAPAEEVVSAQQGESVPAAAPANAVAVELPDIEVFDLENGEIAQLGSFARPAGATLIWFWAPH